jgi:hypothetical protein
MANVRGFGDLNRNSDDENDGDDDTNDYYAGGEKSGMVVQGAGDRGQGGGHRAVVDDLFESARRLGARDGAQNDLAPNNGASSSAPNNSRAFTGSSYKLSGLGASAGSDEQAAAAGNGDNGGEIEPVMHTITFYGNGIFIVDDGEPRDVQDPANKDFIDSITRGEVPSEFDRAQRLGGLVKDAKPVHVNLVSKMDQQYVPPAKPKYVAFAGQGNKLSSEAAGNSSAAAVEQPSGNMVEVDETLPFTSIQLRLLDGTRMVSRFNLINRVSDIRAFINASRPASRSVAYNLVTSFPTTVLENEDLTIEEAGLANAVILQKSASG